MRNRHPLEYLGLLMLVLAVRWPTFVADWIPEADAYWLLVGHRTAAGFIPYRETFTTTLPLSVYVATALYGLLGQASLWLLKIMACLSVTAIAAATQDFYAQRKMGTYGGWVAGFTILLLSLPWQTQHLRLLVFDLPLVIGMLRQAERLGEQRYPTWRALTGLGLWIGAVLLWDYHLLPFLFMAAWLFFSRIPFRVANLFQVAAGILLWLVALGYYLWWTDSLTALSDQLRQTFQAPYAVRALADLHETKMWLLVLLTPAMLLALVGFAAFRVRYYRMQVRARQADTLLLLWVAATLVHLTMTWPMEPTQTQAWVALPAALYGMYAVEHALSKRWLRRGVLLLGIGVAVASTTQQVLMLTETDPQANPGGLPGPPVALAELSAGSWVWSSHIPAASIWKYHLRPANPAIVFASDRLAQPEPCKLPDRAARDFYRGYWQILQRRPPTAYIAPPATMQQLEAAMYLPGPARRIVLDNRARRTP